MLETAPSDATRTLVVERDLSHPPAKVWRALTQGPLIEDWLLKNDFVPEVGRTFTFRNTPAPNWNGVIDGEVLTVEPHEKLAYSWVSMGVTTVVTWTLSPTASGTRLRMEQAGFRDDQGQNYKGAAHGWNVFIGKMATVLDGLD